MDIMKDFEGIKKINNDLNLDINNLYELLLKYKNQIGNVFLNETQNKIICDTTGKYCAHVYLQGNKIVIERNLDEGEVGIFHDIGENIKSINLSIIDRMIEQIYDLLVDYIKNNGEVKEHITGVEKVLYSYQKEGTFSDVFFIKDENNKNIYEVKNNKLLKEYTVANVDSKMKKININYKEKNQDRFNITLFPYTTILLSKAENQIKTIFTGNFNNKNLKISADFTDNHFIIELDEIVIGAVDSLYEVNKNEYRLEINNLEYEALIVAIQVIIDLYTEVNK